MKTAKTVAKTANTSKNAKSKTAKNSALEARLAKNTIALLIFNIAKILFPFFTLPYLTRVLSTDVYGVVAYTKTIMNYLQILVDFGFVLSATKDVVEAKLNQSKLGQIVGDTMVARILLGIIGLALTALLAVILPLLRENLLYVFLSYMTVFLSIFLLDFLFRGLEKMHIITIRFVVMKIISTILTFLLIKSDADILLIPVFDILSSIIAVGLVWLEFRKLNLKLYFTNLRTAFLHLKNSFVYFFANVASTSFNAVGTIIVGLVMTPSDVAYWSVCMQVLGSIQACCNPIADGIYPEMVRTKSRALIKFLTKLLLPVVTLGCVILYFATPLMFQILGGDKYAVATPVFRILIGSVFLGIFAILYGWPVFGPIGKAKQATFTTWISALLYFALMALLIITNNFTLISLAVARVLTEVALFGSRYFYYRKYRKLLSAKPLKLWFLRKF